MYAKRVAIRVSSRAAWRTAKSMTSTAPSATVLARHRTAHVFFSEEEVSGGLLPRYSARFVAEYETENAHAQRSISSAANKKLA